MHWADTIAEKLVERGEPVIETGTSISGIPHIGNASDVIRGDAVKRALENKDVSARLIWVADDSDPFRSVPGGMQELKDELGKPVYDVREGSFLKKYRDNFVNELKEFGVEPEIHSGTELYRSCGLCDEIKIAFEKREKIVEILNKFRNNKLPDDYVPWSPVCRGCGKISTPRVTGVDGYKVSYVCEDIELKGGKVGGCDYEGVSDALKGEGKLPWRVEWPARWHHFKVTCEPFGKDHAAAGGSYDTCKIISKEIFGWRAPEPVIYEFLTINGAKISSSAGNVITLSDWKRIAEPEVLRYFMFKKLNKQRDIDLSKIPNITDEYDNTEKAFLENGEKDATRMFELAQVREKPRFCGIPYTLCAVLSQIIPDFDEKTIVERVKESGYEVKDGDSLMQRVKAASEWVNEGYAPEYLKFELSEGKLTGLSEKQKKFLMKIPGELNVKWTPQTFHKRIYELAREADLDPKEAFKAIYQTLIGKDKGPKAAIFLLSLDKEFLKSRFT